MRTNPLKPRLAAGGQAFGTMIFEFFTPGIAQICKTAGAEFILYDMEHSGLGFESLKVQVTDYERFPEFVPGILGNRVLEAGNGLKTIEQRGKRLMDGLKEIFEDNDIPAVFSGYPAMFSFAIGVESVTARCEP